MLKAICFVICFAKGYLLCYLLVCFGSLEDQLSDSFDSEFSDVVLSGQSTT